MNNNENIIFEYDLTFTDILHSYFIFIILFLFVYSGSVTGLYFDMQMPLIEFLKCPFSNKYLILAWCLIVFFILFIMPMVFILRNSLKITFYDDKVVFSYKIFKKPNKTFLYKDIDSYVIGKCLFSAISITAKEGSKSGMCIFVNKTTRSKIEDLLKSKVTDIKEIKDKYDKPSFYITLLVIGFIVFFLWDCI